MTPRKWTTARTMAAQVGALMLAGVSAWGCGEGGGPDPGTVHRVTVPTGTTLRVALEQEIGLRTAEAGDRFTARVLEPVAPGDGHAAPAVPTGAVVQGRVVAVRESRGVERTRILRLCFETVRVRGESPVLSARIVDARPRIDSASRARTRVAGPAAGAAVPATIGTLVGGGASDAAVGTGVVLEAASTRAVLPRASEMRIELKKPLRVPMP